MKKLIAILLLGMAFAGQITERVYLTPTANGRYQSATMQIIGSGNIISVNNTQGLTIKAGSKGVSIDNLNVSGISTLNILKATTVTVTGLTTLDKMISSGATINGVILGASSGTITGTTISGSELQINGGVTLNGVLRTSGAITGASYSGGTITGTTISGSALQINGGVTANNGSFSGTVSANEFASRGLTFNYIEGTWIPCFDGGYNSSGTVTYNVNTGNYVKIGKQVTATWRTKIGGGGVVGGSGGSLFNLPFTVVPDTHATGVVTLSGVNLPTGCLWVTMQYIQEANTNYYWHFVCVYDDGTVTYLSPPDFKGNSVISGTVTYFAN